MTTFDDQYFFQSQLVNPTDMNKFYQNVANKLTAYFPVVPCICHGVTYTQTGTSNIFRFAKGMIRFKDQSNPLSAAQSQVQATFANIDVADVTVSCPDASGNYYVVALLTMTQVSPSQVTFSAAILPTSMTLAQIAATGKPDLYLPLYRITNTNGVYALSVNFACAVNPYYSLKLEGTPTAPTAAAGTNTTQLATTEFANGVTPVNTKYDFIVTGDNTPTFAAGEEYILYPNNISGYVEFELTFLSQHKTGATNYGEVTAKFSIDHNSSTGFSLAAIKLLSLCQSGTAQNLTNLFTFTSYLTTAPYTINGVTIPTGQIIYTIKLNNALTYSGTTNSIFAKVSSNAISANNVMNGSLAPAVLGIVSTQMVGATAVIKADNALFQSSLDPNNFVTNLITGLTQVKPYFSKYKYTDPVAGLDTNNGSYNAPYKTMLYSVTNNPTGTIHVLMGQSTEPAFSIPADKTNIDIIAQGTRSALNGFTNKVTVLGTGAGSVRFQDLNFGGGLTRAATSTCGIYVYDGSIGAGGFIQSGNGYTEISQTDASNGANTLSAGTTVFYGGKSTAPVITGTGTVVTMDNVGTVIGNSTMATGGTLYVFESNWIAAATGHAITSATGTVTTMQGCNFIRPNGTSLASISVANYDIQNTDFDKPNSVLTTHIGNYDWYAKLGLLNADTITTATKMLVRKATGEIAEQVITAPANNNNTLSFNVPIATVYADAAIPAAIILKNSGGTTQLTQNGLLCNSTGLMNITQQFSLVVASGQTISISGRLTFYNTNTITQSDYHVNIQVLGLTTGGQLVNLGTQTQTTLLSKLQYGYTNANFTAAQLLVTDLIAIGIQAQVVYAEDGNTAAVNTMFAQVTIS